MAHSVYAKKNMKIDWNEKMQFSLFGPLCTDWKMMTEFVANACRDVV